MVLLLIMLTVPVQVGEVFAWSVYHSTDKPQAGLTTMLFQNNSFGSLGTAFIKTSQERDSIRSRELAVSS